MNSGRRGWWFLGVSAAFLLGCSGDAPSGGASSGDGSGGAAASVGWGGGAGMGGVGGVGGASGMGGVGGAGGMGGAGGLSLGFCQGKLYACGDLMDNDADGLADAADPDCLGACDHTESNHGIEIPDGEQLCMSDCYWDSNAGSGNDECRWSHHCDSLSPSGSKCPYDPSKPIPGTFLTCAELTTMQSPVCADICAPITPNGCDAFGCCEFPSGSQQFVYLGSESNNFVHTCSSSTLGDPSQCYPCTPVPAALNPCDACELCLGKTQLEAGCNVQMCPAGAAACGLPGQAPCVAGEYCVTGCCRPTLN